MSGYTIREALFRADQDMKMSLFEPEPFGFPATGMWDISVPTHESLMDPHPIDGLVEMMTKCMTNPTKEDVQSFVGAQPFIATRIVTPPSAKVHAAFLPVVDIFADALCGQYYMIAPEKEVYPLPVRFPLLAKTAKRGSAGAHKKGNVAKQHHAKRVKAVMKMMGEKLPELASDIVDRMTLPRSEVKADIKAELVRSLMYTHCIQFASDGKGGTLDKRIARATREITMIK